MKHLSILFTAIFLSYFSTAQDCKFELGLQGGPNLTNMRYESYLIQSNRYPQIAGMGGLFVQYNISNMFALRMDPAFERLANNSGEINYTDPSGNIIGTGIIRFHYDYVTVPVLLRACIGNKIKYFLNAGPSLSFLLGQKTITDSPRGNSTTTNTNNYKTLNFGLTGGIGMAIPIKEKFSLSFELRNNYGLSNIYVSSSSNSAIKTNATSLLVGFSYKLGKNTSKGIFTPTF